MKNIWIVVDHYFIKRMVQTNINRNALGTDNYAIKATQVIASPE